MEDKAESQNFKEWLYVAKSDFATERELMQIARKCTEIYCYYSHEKAIKDQVELASSISQNPNVTVNVIEELKFSVHPEVIAIAETWIKEH